MSIGCELLCFQWKYFDKKRNLMWHNDILNIIEVSIEKIDRWSTYVIILQVKNRMYDMPVVEC